MFSIDFPEIIIIFGVALVVLGPKKLPAAAAKIGRWVGRARSMARQFREQLEQEVASAENAIDIRDSVDSAGQRGSQASSSPTNAPERPPGGSPSPDSTAQGTAQHEPTPPDGAQSAHEPSAHEATPYEPTPYHSSMPEHPMPPPEGYGPAPEQLSFDEQLHNTALPPEGGPSTLSDPHAGDGALAESGSAADPREWMPETQTWMASAGWETPESSAREAARSSTGSDAGPSEAPSAGAATATPSPGPDRDSKPGAGPQRTEAIEHHDR